jgi:hypothetical protein
MKKKIIRFLLFLLGIIIMVGCTGSKELSESSKPEPETKPIPWRQGYYPSIGVEDNILFYNSVEIIMEGNFFSSNVYLDGAINITENEKILQKTVPILTSGRVISFKKDINGKITDMFVKFSLIDKTYILNFKVTADGSFNLNLNDKAKLFFENKEYNVLATIKGDECKLLCLVNIKKNVEYIKEEAEGVD